MPVDVLGAEFAAAIRLVAQLIIDLRPAPDDFMALCSTRHYADPVGGRRVSYMTPMPPPSAGALALSRDLDCQNKTARVLAHKMREAMASEVKGYKLGAIGKTVEVDGAYFGVYIKPAKHRKNRRDRRHASNQNGKRQSVVVICERDHKKLPSALKSEASAISYIREHVATGTEMMADDATSWDALHARYVTKRINHQLAYSIDGACTNGAESFVTRLRRVEAWHHHHIAGPYLARYAQESAWREGGRLDNGWQVRCVVRLALVARPSLNFCGY